MSAYIVSTDTIDLLVSATQKWESQHVGDDSWLERQRYTIGRPLTDWNELGALLLQANVDSVSARYQGKIETDEQQAAVGYQWRPVRISALAESEAEILAIVAASIRCFEYQSCEGADYETRDGWKLIKAIESALVRRVITLAPDAPWGWERPVDRARAASTRVVDISQAWKK